LKLRILPFLLSLALFASAEIQGQTFDDLARRALAARDANDLPQAIDLFQQALRINPRWSEGWWFLGTAAYDADRYDIARDALARCVALKPDVAPAWGLLGLSEFQLGDYGNALRHIEQSLLDPRLDGQMARVLRFHEGMLLAHAGEFDRAMASYALFAHDDHPPTALLPAIGITALREPLLPSQIPPERRELVGAAGATVWAAMSQDEAHGAAAFQRLLSRFPASPEVHVLMDGYLLVAPLRAAGDEFRRELQADPSNSAAATMLACLLLNHDDRAGALPWATKAVQLAPKLSMAQYALGRSLAATADLAEGIRHLELAVHLDPTNIDNGIALASAYSKAGRTAEARAERDRTMELARRTVPHA
jgi:tetratricopeptide (TPR) repeat protein